MSKKNFRVDKGLTFKPIDKSTITDPQVNDIVNDSVTGELVKYNGVSWEELGGSGGFGDLDVFAQVTNVNTEASDFVTTGSANATLTKDTHPFMGEAFKLTITSATGADLFSTRRGIDYAVPEEFRGQSVQLTYDYISDVAKGSICFEVTNLFDASTIVYTTELQAQPDTTGILTKGFIFFTVPQTASTIRIAMKRPSGAPDITAKTFWFNNIELRKYQMIINPIRPAIGTIQEFAGPVANIPYGFLNCDGAAVSRSTYAKLFAVIGTTYGTGDGSTTFNLPNTQGIGLRGVGSQTYGSVTYSATLGQKRNDAIQNITGRIAISSWVSTPTSNNGAFSTTATTGLGSINGPDGNASQTRLGHEFNASLVARTDTQTHGADLAVNYMICFDDGPARYADYTLNQDVSFVGINNSTQSGSTATNISVTAVKDTVGAWTGSTFVVPSAGDYDVGIIASATSGAYGCSIYVNGVLSVAAILITTAASKGSGMTTVPNLKAYDVISIRSDSSTTLSAGTRITINKRATSQQVFTPIAQRYIVKTYQSGTSWYEVCNDGWVRQGDYINSGTDSSRATTLVIPMRNADYKPSSEIITTSTSSPTWEKVGFSAISSTQVTLWAGSVLTKKWSVEGYGDSAAVKALGANPAY